MKSHLHTLFRAPVTAVTARPGLARHNKTMSTAIEKTVGEIAAANPASVRVFEKHGIDYCCGGKISLSDACLGRGIEPQALLREIDQDSLPASESSADWQSAPLDRLIDHILTRHHAYLKSELPRLARLSAKVNAAHAERHSATLVPLEGIFLALKAELESHLMKEEMVLFPVIRNLELAAQAGGAAPAAHCGSVNNPIRVMEHEHDSAGQALAYMRQLTGGYTPPADGCNTFRALYYGLQELEADLHQHIHLENNILFPRAARLESAAA